MTMGAKVRSELTAMALLTLYFLLWIGGLVLIKTLILAEYRIAYSGLSVALVGALIFAKVVIVLEHVSLGAWVCRKPRIVEVLLRTLLYALGVGVVLVLEKSFETRHEFGGFLAALLNQTEHEDWPHVLANLVCITGALLTYNVFSVVREHLDRNVLRRMFLEGQPS